MGSFAFIAGMAVMDLSRADNGGASVVTAAAPSVATVDFTRKEPQN